MTRPALPPIERSIHVSWDPASAFERFTGRFSTWWPSRTHSIGGERVKQIVFEPRVGGRIFEEHIDGRRFQWGEVVAFEPPSRVAFTWHPSREPSTAQHVEVRFVPDGPGTRVELISTKWENWGAGVKRARRGYNLGWNYVLHHWAERGSIGMTLVAALSRVVVAVERLRGGRAGIIARSRGEMR
jgi:uncharacterized protein YndB with AHSA1/START domain